VDFQVTRTVVLIGMMGAGKTSVGRRLAARLRLPFADSDAEIAAAAGVSVPEFFATHGEAEFRAGERRVIARLLEGPVSVLSIGGGAFMAAETRDLIKAKAVSVWLRADIEILLRRTGCRDDRPLLQTADPRQRLTGLLEQRAPHYATADIQVASDDRPIDETVTAVIDALRDFMLVKENP